MPWRRALVTHERGSYGVLATMSGEVELAYDEVKPRERGSFIRFRDEAHPGRTRCIPTRTIVIVDLLEDE